MTMKKIFSFVAWGAGAGLVLAGSAKTGLAADKVSYSGKYSAEGLKTNSGGATDSTLEVVQNEDSIEVTRVELGKRTTCRCPFNGSEGDYTGPGGVSGRCKAQLKAKHLILESVVAARPQPTAPSLRMHTKERWPLSADAKTLTIKSDVDFPDFPSDISAAVAGTTSGTRKYTRTESP
jgi:hypothetical protein